VGLAEVLDDAFGLEGLFVREAGFGGEFALEVAAFLGDDVVLAALAVPLPDDRRPGIDLDGWRVEREGTAITLAPTVIVTSLCPVASATSL